MSDKESATGDQTAFTFLFNYYFDIPTKYPIKPFLTAGIGAARIDVNDLKSTGDVVVSVDENDTVFAYQFGLGATWAMSKSLDLELKYRYFGTQEASFDDADLEVGSHNIILGLRVAL